MAGANVYLSMRLGAVVSPQNPLQHAYSSLKDVFFSQVFVEMAPIACAMLLHEAHIARLKVMRGLVVRFDFPYPMCADLWIEIALWWDSLEV